MTQSSCSTDVIEVLAELEPMRHRPGMYTDTTRPNHLGQGVIDNSVDEALAGHARRTEVILHADQSLEVTDGERDMPVDIHPEEGVPAVRLTLYRLYAGDKFSNKNYRFSDGLHGMGISVVNALLKHVKVTVRRDGQVYSIAFENSEKVEDLHVTDTCDKRNTGTSVRSWPDESFLDSPRFSVSRLTHLLKTKTVLCPDVEIVFRDQVNDSEQRWCYADGLNNYLCEAINGLSLLSEKPFVGTFSGEMGAVSWALLQLPEGDELLTESYVNLIPIIQGGTHVNGLRQGLLDAMHKFCEYRNILSHDVELSAEDIWGRCAYVLLMRMQDPQFAGQTKERLSSRQCAAFISGVVKDTFSLWLDQNVQAAGLLVEMVISSAQRHLRTAKKVVRKKLTSGPALLGRLVDCTAQDLNRTELFLVEGDSAGGSAGQVRDREYRAIMPLRGRILNTWEVSSDEVLTSQKVHGISVVIGIDPDSDDLSQLCYDEVCTLAGAGSGGLHIATLLCALFVRHLRTLVKEGHVYVALPPLYRIDLGKEVYYTLMEEEKTDVLEQLKRKKGKPSVQRSEGLGEMNPMQLRETAFGPNTRRLVQLVISDKDEQQITAMIDMLLIKKRSEDRCNWLQEKGGIADLGV